jgi:hypothetical protein
MTIQTVEFNAAPGLTISVRRFARYGDTILETSSATERTNKRGWYSCTFDTTGGTFDLSFMVGSDCVGTDQVELTDTVATFQANSIKAGQTTTIDATSAQVAAVETDTQDIQSRLPAALVSGRMDASVGAMAANTLTASALAADAVTEIATSVESSLSSQLDVIQAKTDLITQAGISVLPGDNSSAIYITRHDAYDGVANAKKSFVVTKDYTNWTGTFTVRHRTTNASLCSKSVTVASSTLLEVSLASSDTAFSALVSDDEFGPHPFDVEMVSGSSKQQAVYGVAVVRKDVTT